MAIRKAIRPEPRKKKIRIVRKPILRGTQKDQIQNDEEDDDAPPSFSEPIIAFLKRCPIRYHKDKK